MHGEIPRFRRAVPRAGPAVKACTKAILWLAVLVLLPVGIARAQVSNSGQITGTVVDPSGKVIPGAEVTVSNAATNFTITVKASASGVYVFPDLQSGTYQVEAAAKGFAKAVYSNVAVQVGQTTNVDVKMTIGATSQTVTVSATAQVLQTTQNTLATTISSTLINNLPLNGRDLSEFATLTPGAVNPIVQGTRYTTFDNLPNAANNISVNGTQDQFLRFKTFTSSFYPPAPIREGAFSEATVSSSGLESANGAGGSQVQFATKSGTSQFHGRAFWEAINSYFGANSWTNNAHGFKRPQSHQNYFGGSLQGPLLPKFLVGSHKTLFFVQVEYFNQPGSSPQVPNMLTSSAATGLFTYEVTGTPSALPNYVTCGTPAGTCTADLFKLASEYNASNSTSFPTSVNGSIATVLNQIGSYCPTSKCVPTPLAPTPAGMATNDAYYLQSLDWTRPSTYKNWFPTTRLDVDLTSKLHWSDSWDLWWRNIGNVAHWPGGAAGSGFKSTYYTWSNNFRWTISPTMINTANFGIMADVEAFNPAAITGSNLGPFKVSPVQGNPSQIEIPFGVPTLVPGFIVPEPRDNPIFNPSDTLRWTHGNHSFYIGGEVVYANAYDTNFGSPPVPDYSFVESYSQGSAPALSDPVVTNLVTSSTLPNINAAKFSPVTGDSDLQAAQSLYAFLTGDVNSVSGTGILNPATGGYVEGGTIRTPEAMTHGGVYFQDSWRATSHFTLNYGLRWQLTGALHNTNNTFFAASYADLLGPSPRLFAPGAPGGIQNPYIAVDPAPYHGDFKQLAPNFGFAWNPDFANGILGRLFGGNNTVIRASYSLDPYVPGWILWETAVGQNPGGDYNGYTYSADNGNFTAGSVSLTQSGSIQDAAIATASPTSFQSAIPESAFGIGVTGFGAVDPKIKYPYVEQWNLGVQRQLPGNFVVEVDYVGNHGVHAWQNYNLNEVNATSNGFLTQFEAAQGNLAINNAGGCGNSFADPANGGCAGTVSTPIFDAAFSGLSGSSGYKSRTFIGYLGTGQAGALANRLATTYSYLCNMVGANFSPCGNVGGSYPINFWEANPYAAGGGSLLLLSDPGSSTYNALQISVRHPVGHGLDLGANYSFSKSIGSQFFSHYNDSGVDNYVSLRDMAINKGPSDFDLRHVLHAYFTYNLPVGRGQYFDVSNPFVNYVVGGWTVGSILQWQSGLPFLLQGGYDTFNNNDGGVVLNGATRSQIQSNVGVYLTPSSPYAPVWFSPTFNSSHPVLSNTAPGTIGQLLYLYGPSFIDTDISLIKSVPIRERLTLKIKANFINAFNHPDWIAGSFGAPGYLATVTSTLGRPTASLIGSPRSIQFETSLEF